MSCPSPTGCDVLRAPGLEKTGKKNFIEMADGATTLKGLRAQVAAAAQAQAEERRSLAGNSPLPTTNTPAKPQGCKPVIDGATLRVDDKLRVARERREEAEKQQALRESQIMERERKAKIQVERQLEERQRKVEEQKKKEELRRQAAEDKRKQKQEEEKEHYKAVMQRTLERSQRVEQRQKRWSWGGLTSDSDGRAARRPETCIVDEGLLSRLLTPTQASLARSKSAAALSAEATDSQECHLCPRSASASPLQPQHGPVRSRSSDRHKSGMSTSVSADGAVDPALKNKQTLPGTQRPASPSSTLTRNRSPSPAPSPAPKRTPSPSAAKQSPRTRPPSPGVMKQRPPSPQPMPTKPPPIQKPALTPTGPPTLRKRESKSKDLCPVQPVAAPSPDASKAKEKDGATGTNSAAEAAKILAENRRLMREQKEKEEQLRLQREEEEKLRIEEEKRLAEEARLKQLEEEKKLAEERKLREEEAARQAEEERVRVAEEEAQRQAELQREKEEAEARALEKAEKERQERERALQQNQQERMERKKRIEEIMKRTRKGEQNDVKKDDGNEVNDQMNCDMNDDESEFSTEAEKEVCDLSSGEPVTQNEEPVGSVNGKPETEDKENNNGICTDETHADSPVPKARLVEGSEFLNEQDSAKVMSGLNGKSNQWSFEDLIDLNGHKTRPLMEAEDSNQVLMDCDGTSEGNRVTFEGTPVNTIHSSNQPIEALSEI